MDCTSADVCEEQRRLEEEQLLGTGSGESKAGDADTIAMDIDDDDDMYFDDDDDDMHFDDDDDDMYVGDDKMLAMTTVSKNYKHPDPGTLYSRYPCNSFSLKQHIIE